MAIIGEMKKLTIGGSTYTIPEYSLPIASASTLGGVKIGTGLSINSTTGVLSATGLDFDEADPVFVASPAYGITQNDIDGWNAKVSDDKTWNGIELAKQQATYGVCYVPASLASTGSASMSFTQATPTPTASKIAKYDSNAYLNSTTPSKNDNSTKVATTAYVDGAISTKIAGVLSYKGTKATVADVAAITDKSKGDVWHVTADGSEWAYDGDAWQELGTAVDLSNYALTSAIPTKTSDLTNDSGFIISDSDEKLKTTSAGSSNTQYYPIFGEANSTASTKLYSSNFRVKNYNSVLELQLGQTSSNPTRGKLTIVSNQPNSYGYLITSATADQTYTLPDKTGTIALTSDIPTVPTNISAFTNDSGYITSADVPEGASAYTGTISAVTSGNASAGSNNGFARGDHVHNITKTTINTVLGTGSGTTKFYREDGTWATPAYTTNTDTKLQVAAVTSGTTYYPIVGTGTTAATRQYDTTGFIYKGTNGTTSAVGSAQLTLGNSTASGTANNKQGELILYGTNSGRTTLVSGVVNASANYTVTLPNTSGTVALTKDIPSVPTTATNSATGITASTTANKTTVGSSSTDYGVKSAGSGSFTQGSFSGGSFTQGTDSFTANVPTKIDTTKFNAGSYSHSGFNGGSGSFTQGSFTGGSLVVTSHVLSFTPATHGADSHTHTAATYGTDSFTAPSLGTGFYTAGTAASFTQGEDSFTPATHGADSHTHTAPTLGSKVPTVSTASATVTITDNGHTHTLS